MKDTTAVGLFCVLLVLATLAIASAWLTPCGCYGATATKDLPARCLKEYEGR